MQTAHYVQRIVTVYAGSLNTAVVRIAEVFQEAIRANSAALIVVHNHPSGDPTPSKADVEMTKQVVQALAAVGITLHDHVVVGNKKHASFRTMKRI